MADFGSTRDPLAPRGSESLSRSAFTPPGALRMLVWPALAAAILSLTVILACVLGPRPLSILTSRDAASTPVPAATVVSVADVGSPRAQIDVWTGGQRAFQMGEPIPIQVWSSSGGTVSVSALDPAGTRQLLFNTAIESGAEIQQVWCCPYLEGRWLLEADLNQGEARAEWDLAVDAGTGLDAGGYEVVYDFVARAQDATWIFYYATAVTETYQTASAHDENYTMGRVEVLPDATLEGGEPASNVLLTNPPWIAEGIVAGKYNVAHLDIQDGDYLFVRLGFLDGSYRGDAFFRVVAEPDLLEAPAPSPVRHASSPVRMASLGPRATAMISVRDHADPQPSDPQRIKTLTWPLQAGVPVAFIYLIVDNGPTAYQDRAVWVDAEIRRPLH